MGRNRVSGHAAVQGAFRNRLGCACALIVAFLMIVAWAAAPVRASADDGDSASDGSASHYNVVLVNDASGSMARTDPDDLRFSAMSRFLALLSNEGNRVGVVSFGEDVAYSKDLASYDSMQSKSELVDELSQVEYQDWTNVGAGLQKAVSMLDADADADIPSVILLLTDGNTDMETDEELQQSEQTKAQAIEDARTEGYQVYSVSLNADDSANSAELQQISSATGGEFQEVSSAGDLSDVYDMFYRLLFQNKTSTCQDGLIPDNGIVECEFEVASLGVEEANILITGQPSDYELTDPSDQTMTKDMLADSAFVTDEFVSIKVVAPQAGVWRYTVVGTSGEYVRIDIVRNVDLSVEMTVDGTADGTPEDEYPAGDDVGLNVAIAAGGRTIEAEQYADFDAVLNIVDANGETATQAMRLGDDGFTAEVNLTDRGVYQISAEVTGQDYDLTSEPLTLNVGNSAPTKVADIEQSVTLWPFIDNSVTIDLTPGATDAQDDTLTYEVESTAFQPDDYTLDGADLTVSNFSLPQGSFTIRAYDSDGAYCTFNVLITTINVGLITLIVIAAGALIALIVIAVVLYILLNKRFTGKLFVCEFNFDDGGVYHEEVSRQKSRGRIKLAAFGVNTYGIDPKAYIQASGKDYVTLIVKTPVFSGGRQTRKVRIPGNGYPVTVCPDPAGRYGVQIRFESRKVRTRGGM